jgi:hypothetical protein
MADAPPAPASTDARLRQSSAVSSAAVVGWLVAFTLLEWAYGKWLSVAPAFSLASLPRAVSALECLEIFLIVRMFHRRARAASIGAIEAAAILALVAVVCIVTNERPFFSAGVLSLFVVCRFGRSPAYRALAIALFAFVAQYLLQVGPFIWLHAFVGRLDAALVRTCLARLGYDVTGYSTFVVRASQNFAIDVQAGCASSYVASTALAGFVIVVLGLRGRFQRSDLVYASALLAGVLLVNWLRLLPIALSRAGWLFWHEGAGGAVVAAVDGVLVVGMAFLAVTRWPQRDKPR